MAIVQRMLLGLGLVFVSASGADALCADVNGDGQVTAADALAILKTAVGQDVTLNCSCAACGSGAATIAAKKHCADVSGDGSVTASDALTTLKSAVGQSVAFDCLCSACTVECLDEDALDGRTYNEIYTCDESFSGGPPSCVDDNVSDAIQFTHTGNGTYEIRDVPDTGFIYNGVLECSTFTWDALEPGEYTEHGIWNFDGVSAFAGFSQYEAIDHSYEGDCFETGAEQPDTPSNPDRPPGCSP